jgi:hypothetical protein
MLTFRGEIQKASKLVLSAYTAHRSMWQIEPGPDDNSETIAGHYWILLPNQLLTLLCAVFIREL